MSNILRGLGVAVAAATLVLGAYGVQAQAPKKETAKAAEKKPATCNSLKDETACKARADCEWVSAVVDAKTKKEKRKAYCRSKPKPKAPVKKDDKKK